MSKLDKKTLKWAAKRIEEWAAEQADSTPTHYFDAAHRPTQAERAGRALLLLALAKEIKRGDK